MLMNKLFSFVNFLRYFFFNLNLQMFDYTCILFKRNICHLIVKSTWIMFVFFLSPFLIFIISNFSSNLFTLLFFFYFYKFLSHELVRFKAVKYREKNSFVLSSYLKPCLIHSTIFSYDIVMSF